MCERSQVHIIVVSKTTCLEGWPFETIHGKTYTYIFTNIIPKSKRCTSIMYTSSLRESPMTRDGRVFPFFRKALWFQ